MKKNTISLLRWGFRDAVPVGLGYLAVSFSLGIMCRNAGLNAIEGAVLSLLCNASAGEYAALTVIAAWGTLWEMALLTLIANARYLLMSFALSQKIDPKEGILPRFIMGFDLTDELFSLAVARPEYTEPPYYYGAMLISMPLWALGTALGVAAGNVLPSAVVSALSVALYGMFLAVIIPKAKQDRRVALLVVISFIASFLCSRLPGVKELSDGMRILILTVILSAGAAAAFPQKEVSGA